MESEFCKGLKLVGGKRTPVVTKRHHRGNGSHHQAEKRNKAQTDGKQLLMKAASAKRLDVPKIIRPEDEETANEQCPGEACKHKVSAELDRGRLLAFDKCRRYELRLGFSTMCGLQSPAEEGRVFAMFSTYDSGRPRRQGAAWLHAATSSASGSTPFSSSASRARRQLALLAFESFD